MIEIPEPYFKNVRDAAENFRNKLESSVFKAHAPEVIEYNAQLNRHLEIIESARHVRDPNPNQGVLKESIDFLQSAVDWYAHFDKEVMVESGELSETRFRMAAQVETNKHMLDASLRGLTSQIMMLQLVVKNTLLASQSSTLERPHNV
jgi:hypothetical protein